MAETFQYKVRDKAGNMVTGTLVADNELLVLQRLREMGYTPLEVGKEKKGLNLEIKIRKPKVKLKDLAVFSRQFATMINSGLPILRALAILAEQTTHKLLAEIAHASAAWTSSRGRRSRARCRSIRRSSTSLRLDGQVGRDRRVARQPPCCSSPRCSSAGAPAPQDEVGDDLPGGRRRPGDRDHDRDAAVRRAAVQEDLRAARGQLPLPTRVLLVLSDAFKKLLVDVRRADVRRALPAPPVQGHRERTHEDGTR